MNSIFISLVAYCDNEINNTITDIYANAKNPERVFVGLVNQDDDKYEYKGMYAKNVRIINITPQDSDGYSACRVLCNTKLFNNEDFYFQIAPHSRLLKNFDDYLVNKYKELPIKSVLVGTPSDYNVALDKKEFKYYISGIKCFNEKAVVEGTKIFNKDGLKFDKDGLRKVLFFIAGCIFVNSDWIKDVSYNPNIFLWGEELDISIRSYGEGYKAYLMKDEVVWHLWGQQNRKALGWEKESKRYHLRNNAGLDILYNKLLNKEYKKQDDYFEAFNLDYESLKISYIKFLTNVRGGKMKVTAKYTRNYSSSLRTIAGQDLEIDNYFIKKYPSHFIVKMVADKPKISIKMVAENSQKEQLVKYVKNKTVKKSNWLNMLKIKQSKRAKNNA